MRGMLNGFHCSEGASVLAVGSREGPSEGGLQTLPLSPCPPFALSTPSRTCTSGCSMKSQAKGGLYFHTVFDFAVLSGRQPEQGDKGERKGFSELQTQTFEAGLSEVTACTVENASKAFYKFCTQKNVSAKLDSQHSDRQGFFPMIFPAA